MSTVLPTAVLSDVLHRELEGKRIRAAVFTTYCFDPEFFEGEVLPVLFDQSFTHVPKLRLVQLEEALRQIEHVAVYYDPRALLAGGAPAQLDTRRFPVRRTTGVFHPKLILLLTDSLDDRGDSSERELMLVVSSANLTRAGWWENVEAAWYARYRDGDDCTLRDDLLGLIARIRAEESTGDPQHALTRVEGFVRENLATPDASSGAAKWLPRLFYGQQPLPAFLKEAAPSPSRSTELEVVAPFFDESAEASTLGALVEALRPTKTRVFLPIGADGSGLCTESFFRAVNRLPKVRWGRLPRSLLSRGAGSDENTVDRFVHAKVYRLLGWGRRGGFVLVGSVNLTSAAHSHAGAGNLEAAAVIATSNATGGGPWLEELGRRVPSRFKEQPEDDDTASSTAPPLVVRHRWDEGVSELFLLGDRAPAVVELRSSGSLIAQVRGVPAGRWSSLDTEATEALAELLRSTSFVDVRVDDGPLGTILVREEGMAFKPSILFELTVEEILRYWSLLSPEQREVFVEAKGHRLLVELGHASPDALSLEPVFSMFDTFAGIFHAFSQLELYVCEALEDGRESDAVYQLFGNKYDSLPVLLEKVLADEEGDQVNRYITLLTAAQVTKRLEDDYPEFFEKHAKRTWGLRASLDGIPSVRSQVDPGDKVDRRQFFEWFEQMFFARARRSGEM